MSAILSIRLSEAAFARLQERAAREGTTPEAVAAAELERDLPKSETDPFMKWAGAFQSDVPDAADRHDYYIGQALAEELTDKPKP
jgi:hypothetical protein